MTSTSWFLAGLLAGAALMLGVILLGRTAPQAGRRNGRLLLAGALGTAATVAVAAGMSLAIDSRQGSTTTAPAPAAAGSPPRAMPAPAPMPSAATMAQVLAMSGGSGKPSAEPMDQAAARLAARLQSKGGTAADWNLLAQAYDFLGRPQDAQRARARAAQAGASPAPAR
jgi:cytochrome c-type biogenesis protein CcmH/NrfG